METPYLGQVSIVDVPPPGLTAPFLGTYLRTDMEQRLIAVENQVTAVTGGSGTIDLGTF